MIVVAAVVEAQDRFLVTCRQAGVHLAGMWEFPGGKVHEGEAHVEALRREMLEELGCDVDVGELMIEATHEYDDRRVSIFFYRCRLLGEPRPQLGQQMRWVARRDLATLGFPPADETLIRMLS